MPLGIDLGGSGPVIASPQPEPPAHTTQIADQTASAEHDGEMHMAHEGHNDAHGTGTVNSVDPAQHKVNLTHNPIPEVGWPTMTMEFPVASTSRAASAAGRRTCRSPASTASRPISAP